MKEGNPDVSTDVEMHRNGMEIFFRLERQRLYDALEEKEQQLTEALEMLTQLIVLSHELGRKHCVLERIDRMYENAREILLKRLEDGKNG